MPDLELNRTIPAPPEEVWEAMTDPDLVLRWWGHDTTNVLPGAQLDFRREGPWDFEMETDEGNRMRASGQVTHVRPKESFGFTWAWHHPDGARGPESHVTMRLSGDAEGNTTLRLTQTDLTDDDWVMRQSRGWISTLERLERMLST